MLQLFGCGIFPHTGSHQSRLTGHWPHSISERPREKKNTSQATDVQPETTHHPLHPPIPPKTAVSSSLRERTRVCRYRAVLRGAPGSLFSAIGATLHYLQKAKPSRSQETHATTGCPCDNAPALTPAHIYCRSNSPLKAIGK